MLFRRSVFNFGGVTAVLIFAVVAWFLTYRFEGVQRLVVATLAFLFAVMAYFRTRREVPPEQQKYPAWLDKHFAVLAENHRMHPFKDRTYRIVRPVSARKIRKAIPCKLVTFHVQEFMVDESWGSVTSFDIVPSNLSFVGGRLCVEDPDQIFTACVDTKTGLGFLTIVM